MICLTVGLIYAPECIKEDRDPVSISVLVFMNNFHNSAENNLSQRETGKEQREKGEVGVNKLSLRKKVRHHLLTMILCLFNH